jgi:hypothetical protein
MEAAGPAAVREPRLARAVGAVHHDLESRILGPLVRYGDRPYLLAFCHTDCIEKTYRLDRIRQIRLEE